MKTKDLWMAIAAFAVAGCSQNEITEINPETNPAIGFSVYTGTQTKGTVTNNEVTGTGIKAKGFGILAYYTNDNGFATSTSSHTPNFMYNQKVEWKTSPDRWEYTPVKYWPNTPSEKLSFFAYAPYEEKPAGGTNYIKLSEQTTGGYPTITFTLQDVANNMTDLVVADAKDKKKEDGSVSFTMAHVLSRALFQAKLSSGIDANTAIFITSAKLLGTTSDVTTGFYKTAIYKYETSAWDYTSATKQSSDYDLASILNKTNASWGADGGSAYTTSSVQVTTTAAELFKKETSIQQYLFLIPPTATGITSTASVKVELTYDIVTKDAAVGGHSKTTSTTIVTLPEGGLKQNTAYKYIFTIGLDKVEVTATVTDWSADTEVTVSNTTATPDAASIKSAISTLSAIKKTDSSCKNFTVYVTGSVTTANFNIDDCIDLDFGKVTGFSSSNTIILSNVPANWTATPSSALTTAGKIQLKKNS